MLDNFLFQLNTQLYYGLGSSEKIKDIIKENTYKNILILVDEGVGNHSDYFQSVKSQLMNEDVLITTQMLRGNEEPSYDYLDLIAEKARSIKDLDCIIAIGGGSCLDIGKAVSILCTNPGGGLQYRGFDLVKVPGIPVIAVPTTAGTGSEVTINAVFINKEEKKKLGINGKYMNAKYAILDANWLKSCPKRPLMGACADTLVHLMESFMGKKSSSLTRIFSKEAFRIMYKTVQEISEDNMNLAALQQQLLASYLAGAALFNTGSGIAGALSYPIGVHFRVPHGIGGGIFIADAVEHNINKGFYDFSELLDTVEVHPEWSNREKSLRVLEIVRDMIEKLEIPYYLDEFGIDRSKIDQLWDTILPQSGAYDLNPTDFDAQKDAKNIFMKHLR